MMFKLVSLVFALQHILGPSNFMTVAALKDVQEAQVVNKETRLEHVAPYAVAHSPTLPRMHSPKKANSMSAAGLRSSSNNNNNNKEHLPVDDELPSLTNASAKGEQGKLLDNGNIELSSWDRRKLAKTAKKKKKNQRRKKPKFQPTKSPTKRSNDVTLSPTGSPTRTEQVLIVSTLVSAGISTLDGLTKPGSPEYAAVQWISDDVASGATFPNNEELIQRFIAAVFASSIVGLDATWLDHTTDECDWTGLTCDKDGAVVEVSLVDMGLSGTLPSMIGSWTGVTSFSIDDNQITGPIPQSTSQMSNIIHFSVSNNQLTGSLPSGWADSWADVEELIVSNNQFSGAFDNSLFDLPNIQVLDILPNAFTNTEVFPSQSPSSMPSLAPTESPTGYPTAMPSSYPTKSPAPTQCQPRALTDEEIKNILAAISTDTLNLINAGSDTAQKKAFEFVRDYPSDLNSCSRDAEWHQRFALAVLYHSMTNAAEKFPANWMSTTSDDECDWDNVYCDSYTGDIRSLYLWSLNLEGTIPKEIGGLSTLRMIHLLGNPLLLSSEDNMKALTNLSSLRELFLQQNGLVTVPTEFGSMLSLTSLSIKSNSLNSIPTELANLDKLRSLSLDSNGPSLLPLPSGICDLLTTANPPGELQSLACGNNPYYEGADCCSPPVE